MTATPIEGANHSVWKPFSTFLWKDFLSSYIGLWLKKLSPAGIAAAVSRIFSFFA
jgi:hypothetical protein